MPKKRKTKLKLPLNTGKPWSIGKILLYFLDFYYYLLGALEVMTMDQDQKNLRLKKFI